MNFAHLHLVLVHIPIVLTPLAVILLLLALRESSSTIRKVGLALLVSSALFTFGAFQTGGEAEEVIEHIAGVSEALIEAHEEAAEISLWLCSISGILALLCWIYNSYTFSKKLFFVVLAVSCAASISLIYTAFVGGKIRHPEAYSTSQLTTSGNEDDD